MAGPSTRRPDPGRPAPPGYRWEASDAGPDWEVAGPLDERRPCRGERPPCHRPVCLVLLRKDRRGWRVRWRYCLEHAFGRWVEDGRVLSWRAVDDDLPTGRALGRGVWRLEPLSGDPDRPALGPRFKVWIELPNGYRSEGRVVWRRDLEDLAGLLREVLS